MIAIKTKEELIKIIESVDKDVEWIHFDFADLLWPHIKAAQDAKWNDAIDEAIKYVKLHMKYAPTGQMMLVLDNLFSRFEELKQ